MQGEGERDRAHLFAGEGVERRVEMSNTCRQGMPGEMRVRERDMSSTYTEYERWLGSQGEIY